MESITIYNRLKDIIPEAKLRIDEPMRVHTSFRIGGPVQVMALPTKAEEIQSTVMFCNETKIPFMVMGNGTNLLISDKGIKGVVIKLSQNFNDVVVKGKSLTCRSGVSLSSAANAAMENGLRGLEFAHGIPGSVGGAAVMNAGAFDGEMAMVVEKVKVLDMDGQIRDIFNKDIGYSYRQSAFQKNDMVLLEVQMGLQEGDPGEIKQKMDDYLARRQKRQPLNYPSAGSAFKRPAGNYAGHLIEKSGLKGYKIGDAMVSDLHAGFIVNLGNASFEDIVRLITHIQKTVKDKFKVDLEPEIRIKGE